MRFRSVEKVGGKDRGKEGRGERRRKRNGEDRGRGTKGEREREKRIEPERDTVGRWRSERERDTGQRETNRERDKS